MEQGLAPYHLACQLARQSTMAKVIIEQDDVPLVLPKFWSDYDGHLSLFYVSADHPPSARPAPCSLSGVLAAASQMGTLAGLRPTEASAFSLRFPFLRHGFLLTGLETQGARVVSNLSAISIPLPLAMT